jgi:predicted permease
MEQLYSLLRSVSIFFLLVIFIQILKKRGIFDTSHLPVFGKLITELILPITIFSTLTVSRIQYNLLYGAGIFLAASLITCGLAYIICRYLHFSDAITGSIVILAGFGSTSTIAYPIISQTYGAGSEAMASALIIGEFGSCIPFFTIGLLIVAYFGSKAGNKDYKAVTILRSFISTPVFFSLVAGLIVSQIPLISELMSTDFFSDFFAYFNNGFEILVAITIGLMLRPVKIKEILPYLIIALPLSLILMPVLIFCGATLICVPEITREVLLIEAAVPSGAIAAVMSERYGCDGALSSTIVIVSFLVSLVTLPALSILLL